MKKILILFLLISLVSASNVFAQSLGEVYGNVKAKITGVAEPSGGEICLEDENGIVRKINRKSWEAAIRLNLVDSPNGGDRQMKTENLDFTVYHNLSNTMFAYATYGNRTIDKNHYEGQVYSDTWKDTHIFAGFGLYLSPHLSVWYGAGRVWAEDEDGEEPQIQTAIDAGIGYDIPLFGNNLKLAYRVLEAKLDSGSDTPIEEATGDQSYTALTISYRVGLSAR